MSIIKIRGLEKKFNGFKAVSGLDLDVKEGEIYGFLGPNGAGKTTTIRIMIGLMKGEKGTIEIDGYDVKKKGKKVRQRLGYLPEKVSFYGNLTVSENLEFLCEVKGCSKSEIDRILKDFKFEEQRSKKCKHLSKGMTQRLGIAQTLIGKPDLLILDEPTAGLDPNIRRWIKDKILSLKDKGKTIFLSSHVLSEVQELCDRVGILNEGSMLAEDDVETLGDKLSLKDRLELRFEPLDKGLEIVNNLDYVERARVEDSKLVLYCSAEKKMSVIRKFLDEGMEITNFSVKEPDLEEVFVRLTAGDGR